MGYHKLSDDDKRVLFYKYAEALDFGDIATVMSLGSEDAARMRHNRAIKKLITRIGGFRPFLDKDISKENSTVDNNEPQEHHQIN
jgi:hypothetical protein